MPRCLAFFVLWFAPALFAAEPVIRAQVVASAELYKRPSFQSKVIETLQAGSFVHMLTKKYVGEGGLGVFYKVKTSSGKIGYLTDSDVSQGSATAPPPIPTSPPVTAPAQPVVRPSKPKNSAFWGLAIGNIDYAEEVAGQKYHRGQLIAGARRVGPRWTEWGLGTNASLNLSPGAPKFLREAGAYGETSGFLILADFLIDYRFLKSSPFNVLLEAGPAIKYSKYSTNIANEKKEANATKFGAALGLGFSYQQRGFMLLIDLKLNIEASTYLSEYLSLLIQL
ncbi:MAG: hypothetical protein AB7F86_04695 [Bdellovibrionales bacterium]